MKKISFPQILKLIVICFTLYFGWHVGRGFIAGSENNGSCSAPPEWCDAHAEK